MFVSFLLPCLILLHQFLIPLPIPSIFLPSSRFPYLSSSYFPSPRSFFRVNLKLPHCPRKRPVDLSVKLRLSREEGKRDQETREETRTKIGGCISVCVSWPEELLVYPNVSKENRNYPCVSRRREILLGARVLFLTSYNMMYLRRA